MYFTVSGVAFTCSHTPAYPIWLHGSQQQEFYWLQQPEPGTEKMLFSPLLPFLKKPQGRPFCPCWKMSALYSVNVLYPLG